MLIVEQVPDPYMNPPEYDDERPICDKCGLPIDEDYFYEFDGKKICENCKFDFVWMHYRKEI